jgi:hypothetical protein
MAHSITQQIGDSSGHNPLYSMLSDYWQRTVNYFRNSVSKLHEEQKQEDDFGFDRKSHGIRINYDTCSPALRKSLEKLSESYQSPSTVESRTE